MYIRGVRRLTSAFHGCCGIHVIFRLWGIDINDAQHKTTINNWLNAFEADENPVARSNGLLSCTELLAETRLDLLVKRLQSQHYRADELAAVPLDTAFAMTLEGIPKQALLFLADNMSNTGDVHTGSYTTRAFQRWFVENDLGSSITSGPVQSTRTAQNIQGWILTTNWKQINRIIKREQESLVTYIKEINNDPRIKAASQARRKEEGVRSKELKRIVCGWS